MFVLRGAQEEQVRALFQPAVLADLEQRSGICIQGGGTDLIVYRQRKRVSPQHFQELMSEGFEVLGLFRA